MSCMYSNSFTLFLAKRLIFSKNNNFSIKISLWICISAIAIGSFALTLIFAIMQGFQTVTETRLQSIHPQIILQAPKGQDLNFAKLKTYLSQNSQNLLLSQIQAITPYILSYGVLHNPDLDDQVEFCNVSLIKSIDPKTELLVSQIATKLENQMTLAQTLDADQIIIGVNLAKNLGLTIGRPAQIFVPNNTNAKTKAINFQKINVIIGNIIKTGISEFDDSLIITSLDFAYQHFPDTGISEIGIKLKPQAHESELLSFLKSKLKLNIFSWTELYTPLIAALKLEKHVALTVAMLVILMALMMLVALLFMLITKHSQTITILTILGLTGNKIRHLFLAISLMITGWACLIGLSCAAGVGLLLQNYPFITLPDAYYLTTLPIQLSWNIFIFVFITTIISALLAAQIPLQLISKINLATLLKTNN